MTGQEIIDAWELWMSTYRPALAYRHDAEAIETWLRTAFLAGVEAAESIWREIPGEKISKGELT